MIKTMLDYNKSGAKRAENRRLNFTKKKCLLRTIRSQNAAKIQPNPKMPKNGTFWHPEIGENWSFDRYATIASTIMVDVHLVDVK